MSEINPELDADEIRLKKVVEQLSEHFDTVLILVTRYDNAEKKTIQLEEGYGNLHARYGWAKSWVDDFEQISREHAKKRWHDNQE